MIYICTLSVGTHGQRPRLHPFKQLVLQRLLREQLHEERLLQCGEHGEARRSGDEEARSSRLEHGISALFDCGEEGAEELTKFFKVSALVQLLHLVNRGGGGHLHVYTRASPRWAMLNSQKHSVQ